jgi:hypothetical protein
MKRQVPLRSKLLFALCTTLPLLPFAAWVFLLTTICTNPRTPEPATRHVTAYSCHGTTVFISDLESAMLHWVIPVCGGVCILLGILAGAAAVLSLATIRASVEVNVLGEDAPPAPAQEHQKQR